MQISRSRERIVVEIPCLVTTVLESLEGTIVDLSEGGAQIFGCSLPAKSQCQVDLDGHIVFGTVRWSEIDRMGIRFPYEMRDGPLFDLLEQARAALRPVAPIRQYMPAATAFAASGGGGFGRRGI